MSAPLPRRWPQRLQRCWLEWRRCRGWPECRLVRSWRWQLRRWEYGSRWRCCRPYWRCHSRLECRLLRCWRRWLRHWRYGSQWRCRRTWWRCHSQLECCLLRRWLQRSGWRRRRRRPWGSLLWLSYGWWLWCRRWSRGGSQENRRAWGREQEGFRAGDRNGAGTAGGGWVIGCSACGSGAGDRAGSAAAVTAAMDGRGRGGRTDDGAIRGCGVAWTRTAGHHEQAGPGWAMPAVGGHLGAEPARAWVSGVGPGRPATPPGAEPARPWGRPCQRAADAWGPNQRGPGVLAEPARACRSHPQRGSGQSPALCAWAGPSARGRAGAWLKCGGGVWSGGAGMEGRARRRGLRQTAATAARQRARRASRGSSGAPAHPVPPRRQTRNTRG